MSDTESPPPIVDFETLENSKENVQPLSSGRRVTALAAVFATGPHARREAQLRATKEQLRAEAEAALQDPEGDPLTAYNHFVEWTIDSYPQGQSAESGLMELLEEATRVLKDDRDGIWRDDLQYLKLWVLYASFVEKPTMIYKFLFANEIGTSHALLYEEYADVLERNRRQTLADEVYRLGIARHAFPLLRLQSRYREFQKRMMSSIVPSGFGVPEGPSYASSTSVVASGGGAAAPANASSSSSSSSSSRPPALASVSGKRSTRMASGNSSRQPTSSSLGASSSSSSRIPAPKAPTLGSSSRSQSNGRVQIFEDPSGGESHADAVGSWTDIGTRQSRVKENRPEARTAAGTTIRQAGAASRSRRVVSTSAGSAGRATSSIVPFVDSEEPPKQEQEQQQQQQQRVEVPVPPSLLRGKQATAAKTSKSTGATEKGKVVSAANNRNGAGGSTSIGSGAIGSSTTSSSSKKKSSSTILPFVDDEAGDESTSGKTSRKSAAPVTALKFMPFSDEDQDEGAIGSPSSAMPQSVSETMLKIKKVETSQQPPSEADALRRDPFKNYDAALRPINDDGDDDEDNTNDV